MTPSDPSATLEAIKERAKSAAAMDVDVLAAFSGVSVGGVIAASAVDVPVLVAALEAVLKAHRPSTTDGRCCWCRDADGQRSAWPCGEYLTITRALKGGTDG